MRRLLLAQMLLGPFLASGNDVAASCELADQAILPRAPSGLAQVSNLGDIRITCRVPARTFPIKAGESQSGLTATTTVYQVSPKGRRRLVPSEVHRTGGGRTPDQETVEFYLHIPLDPAAREAEARRYCAKLQNSIPETPLSEAACRRALGRLQELVYQHRVGQFHVDCRVMDGYRIIGTGTVQLEVLFKGRFSDLGLPGFPGAPPA